MSWECFIHSPVPVRQRIVLEMLKQNCCSWAAWTIPIDLGSVNVGFVLGNNGLNASVIFFLNIGQNSKGLVCRPWGLSPLYIKSGASRRTILMMAQPSVIWLCTVRERCHHFSSVSEWVASAWSSPLPHNTAQGQIPLDKTTSTYFLPSSPYRSTQ